MFFRLQQDQDGDKNALYFLMKKYRGYDATQSYKYKIAKMELAQAFRNKMTLVATPRYHMSEAAIVKLKRDAADFMHDPFFAKTMNRGIKYVNEAAAGYLRDEYDVFQEMLRLHSLNEKPTFVGVADVCLKTDRLPSVVTSGAKGNFDLIQMLLSNISSSNSKSFAERKKEMLDLSNKYITSSQDLSRTGRKLFASLYAAHDLIVFFHNIYLNKRCFANYFRFASAGTFLFNKSSLDLFVNELESLESD